jgi:very-short-patch-repair endonuclease
MATLRRISPAQRGKLDAEGLADVARGQSGVVSRAQLESHGVSDSSVSRWVVASRLQRIHSGVYALGHSALSLRGRLWAALLYAGPNAALSHTTAAWLWSLIDTEPRRIHLTVPGRLHALPGVCSHHSRRFETARCRGLPVTPVARTLVDIGAMLTARQLRRALAEADYRGLLDVGEIERALKPGRTGSRATRAALRSHIPELAQTRSVLEERFLELSENAGLRLPEVNVRVGRLTVDALWRDAGLVVELDGAAAHGSWAMIKRDRRREVALRANGFRVVRYSWDQITNRQDEVVADLRRLLAG